MPAHGSTQILFPGGDAEERVELEEAVVPADVDAPQHAGARVEGAVRRELLDERRVVDRVARLRAVRSVAIVEIVAADVSRVGQPEVAVVGVERDPPRAREPRRIGVEDRAAGERRGSATRERRHARRARRVDPIGRHPGAGVRDHGAASARRPDACAPPRAGSPARRRARGGGMTRPRRPRWRGSGPVRPTGPGRRAPTAGSGSRRGGPPRDGSRASRRRARPPSSRSSGACTRRSTRRRTARRSPRTGRTCRPAARDPAAFRRSSRRVRRRPGRPPPRSARVACSRRGRCRRRARRPPERTWRRRGRRRRPATSRPRTRRGSGSAPARPRDRPRCP